VRDSDFVGRLGGDEGAALLFVLAEREHFFELVYHDRCGELVAGAG